MDGLGYNNWGSKSRSNDDDDRSPPTYSSDQYAFSDSASPRKSRQSQKKGKASDDIYDYSLDNDDDYESSPNPYIKRSGKSVKTASNAKSLPSQRLSTEDRMKEILDRNNAEKKLSNATTQKEEVDTNTWKSSWDDLLAGMNSPELSKQEEDSDPLSPDIKQRKRSGSDQSPTDSSFGDFDISASDFEVRSYHSFPVKPFDRIFLLGIEHTFFFITPYIFKLLSYDIAPFRTQFPGGNYCSSSSKRKN